eukprot:1596379-Prymnesium_polylepis.1
MHACTCPSRWDRRIRSWWSHSAFRSDLGSSCGLVGCDVPGRSREPRFVLEVEHAKRGPLFLFVMSMCAGGGSLVHYSCTIRTARVAKKRHSGRAEAHEHENGRSWTLITSTEVGQQV